MSCSADDDITDNKVEVFLSVIPLVCAAADIFKLFQLELE
jgi:hypothetical protein